MPAGAEQLALARLKSGGSLSVKKEKEFELTLAMLMRRLLLDSNVGLLKEYEEMPTYPSCVLVRVVRELALEHSLEIWKLSP